MSNVTWTMTQVQQVRGLRAEVDVDVDLIERHGEKLLDEVAFKMAKQVAHMAHPLGVDVDPAYRDDFEIVWEKNPMTPWTAKGRLRWNPSTNTVELRGGHLDGQRWAVQNVGDPLRVPRPAMTPFFDADDTSASAALVEIADTYEIMGWREAEHVWVYEAQP